MKQAYKVIVILNILFQTANSQTQLSPDKITAAIDTLFSKYNSETPGVSVAIVKDGKVIFKEGYGMANLEYNIPITSQTVFHVASVSKQFTTFAIYLLERQGKISLEDDIRKYIPEVPDFGTPITVKHLCYHTSGLRDQWGLLTLAGWRMDDVITKAQILKLVNKQKELNFDPGSAFMYSNTGFTLLAEIVEKVSGKAFVEFIKENIFEPLGMNSTEFYDDHEKIVKNRAYSYTKQNGDYKKKKLNYSTVGATSLFTTVEDLSKWILNFEKPIVGDVELIEKFNLPAVLDTGEKAVLAVVDNETIYHCKGQFFRNYKGLTLYNHTGSDAGFRAYLARFPDQKFSVVLLSNEQSFNSLPTGLKIAEFYLKDNLKTRKKNNDTNIQKNKPDKENEEYILDFKDFEGKYYSEELMTNYTIKVQEKKLMMEHKRLENIELTSEKGDKFSGAITFPIWLEFLRDKNQLIIGFKVSNFGAKDVVFHKLK